MLFFQSQACFHCTFLPPKMEAPFVPKDKGGGMGGWGEEGQKL